MSIIPGKLLNAVNLNAAFISKSADETITGYKKFTQDIYSTKLIVSTDNSFAATSGSIYHSGTALRFVAGGTNYFDFKPADPNDGIVLRATASESYTEILTNPTNTFIGFNSTTVGLTLDANGNTTVSGTLSATATTLTSATISGATATTVPYFNASKTLTSSAVTPTELGYLSGVTSSIQTQIGTKSPTASPTFTGTVTIPALTVNGAAAMLITSTLKVTNLNVDRLDDYHAGNATGNIPVSNGTLNTNLNSDMLEGFHASTAATVNTIAQRDVNGYIYATHFNSNRGDTATAATSYMYDAGDGWIRKKTLSNAKIELVTSASIVNGLGFTPLDNDTNSEQTISSAILKVQSTTSTERFEVEFNETAKSLDFCYYTS